MTSGDNSNIVIARVAHEKFEVPRVVARIYDPRRAEIYERLGIPTVASVQWTSDRIHRRLSPDSARAAWTDLTTEIVVVERQIPSHWAARAVGDLESATGTRMVALNRLGVSSVVLAQNVGEQCFQRGFHHPVCRPFVCYLESPVGIPTD